MGIASLWGDSPHYGDNIYVSHTMTLHCCQEAPGCPDAHKLDNGCHPTVSNNKYDKLKDQSTMPFYCYMYVLLLIY